MLTIGEIETLLECIASFGEYFDDYEVLESAKRKLEIMRSKITSSNSDYEKCLDDLQKSVKWNGWGDKYRSNLIDILKSHFA